MVPPCFEQQFAAPRSRLESALPDNGGSADAPTAGMMPGSVCSSRAHSALRHAQRSQQLALLSVRFCKGVLASIVALFELYCLRIG